MTFQRTGMISEWTLMIIE